MSIFLHEDQIKVGMLVKSCSKPDPSKFWISGVSVILSEPFETVSAGVKGLTVKLFSPRGKIEYHNANYLIPVKDESR
tara:strand:+ start:3338 stop:3571 length:234 start_codon:yes stop_codon:yes gene_type:complete